MSKRYKPDIKLIIVITTYLLLIYFNAGSPLEIIFFIYSLFVGLYGGQALIDHFKETTQKERDQFIKIKPPEEEESQIEERIVITEEKKVTRHITGG